MVLASLYDSSSYKARQKPSKGPYPTSVLHGLHYEDLGPFLVTAFRRLTSPFHIPGKQREATFSNVSDSCCREFPSMEQTRVTSPHSALQALTTLVYYSSVLDIINLMNSSAHYECNRCQHCLQYWFTHTHFIRCH